MGFSDEQIRDMLELKEDLDEKIIKYKEQIEKLEKNISVLDAILKQSSFTKASDLTPVSYTHLTLPTSDLV